MNTIRRLSRTEASEKATTIARRLAETEDMKGFDWGLGKAHPDPINTETDGKTPRHWVSLIHYSKNGCIMDGHGVILVDLRATLSINSSFSASRECANPLSKKVLCGISEQTNQE
jgi:hypothetical protein